MSVNLTQWTNPLTGSDVLPTSTGDLLTAAVAYWEDVLTDARSKRPRKEEEKRKKLDTIEHAASRLARFRGAREVYAFTPKRVNKLTVQLATDDLAAVMRAPVARAA